uniref:NSP3 n=1 Tax=Bovine group B rotavirus TaxID=35334 RepID=A0A1Q2U396_9REOV|nr:NSP3 [Bovine group B rotavirus]BAW98432.1 NSP3 [Bovine group B rotavirus]
MALNAVASILGSVLSKHEIDDQLKIIEDFIHAMKDCGMMLDNWRDAYYKLRIPKPMTGTTMAIQLKNMETEVLRLRHESWKNGETMKDRLLQSFDVGKKNGYTVLLPKTRNAEVVLLNSTVDMKLNPFPSDIVDDLIKKNSELENSIKAIQDETNTKIKYQEELIEERDRIMSEMNQQITMLKKKIIFLQEDHKERLELINQHHEEEKKIYKREISELRLENGTLNLTISTLNKQFDNMSLDHMKDIQVLIEHVSDVEERCAKLSSENVVLREEQDEHIRLIKGLADKANLQVDIS